MVQIKLQTLTDNFEIKIDDKNRFFVNGTQQNINSETFMFHLNNIVEDWQPKYENNSMLDGLSYSVVVDKGQDKFSSTGKNKFPDNFLSFLQLIEEVKKIEKSNNISK